ASLLHLGAAFAALFDSRPSLRRLFSVALLLAGFAGFQLSVALPGQRGLESLFAPGRWHALSWTPPGWMATLAGALSDGPASRAVWSALLLLILGAACTVAAHALSQRELLRPAEPVRARPGAAGSTGWKLPLAPGSISALFEKEARTVVRLGWLQLVVVPVAYLLLVHAVLPGPQPLLVAAVYAHLGVLEIATNAFGRDRDAARAWFLWPISLRAVFVLAGAAWAPYAIARALAMPVPAAYAGELLALLLAYPALLGFASRLAGTHREALLGALARDE